MVGWTTKKLGEVLKLEYGKPLPKDKRDEAGAHVAYVFWFSVNWRIPSFELVYANGGIHNAQEAEKLHSSGKGFHTQALPC
jgi:hypothetical protein